VGPALAAAATRSGWRFECYFDALRRGRHFAGDPTDARPGWPNGSLVAGGRHADHLRWLSLRFSISAVGDPDSAVWPVLDDASVEVLARSTAAEEIYAAVFSRLGARLPRTAIVVDAAPQGDHDVVVAPYLYPAFFVGEAALGMEADAGAETRTRLEELGVERFEGLFVSERLPWLDGSHGAVDGRDYADVTAELAERHAEWTRGFLLGDPDLVAAQLGRAVQLQLTPLYGRPQTRVIARLAPRLTSSREPVYGRQYDDHDFFELARLGRGLQVVDPGPPFESGRNLGAGPPPAEPDPDPDDAQLERWAAEGRILSTLLFWCGMVRELDCLPRLIDLVAETGVAAGLVTTAEALELAGESALFLLGVPRERGGVLGLLEPLLASTGRGVSAEALMPPGTLAESLAAARQAAASRLPDALAPTGWWPLLDAELLPHRPPRTRWSSGRPAFLFDPRAIDAKGVAGEASGGVDLRRVAGAAVRRAGLERLFEPRRPFDDARPGALSTEVVAAVREAGFSYMWTKAGFGRPAVAYRDGGFAALTLTAGNWDGWSPFYTLGSARDLRLPERRLLRSGRPGWLVGTIDSPLWALSGEVLEHGSTLYRVAALTARGGTTGRLVNVLPRVIARYACVLGDLGLAENTGE
jgi:hypothetical protein